MLAPKSGQICAPLFYKTNIMANVLLIFVMAVYNLVMILFLL